VFVVQTQHFGINGLSPSFHSQNPTNYLLIHLNAYIESYHSIPENECLSDFDFRAYVDALTHIRRYVEFYNTRRLHSSCRYRPPPAYHQAILSKSVEGVAMRA
jgi:hypothetical protein